MHSRTPFARYPPRGHGHSQGLCLVHGVSRRLCRGASGSNNLPTDYLPPNTVRYKFCMHVLRVFRMPKQRFQEGDSPVLWTFFGSPGANFPVSTWVERPHCTLPPSQKAWKFLPETVRSFRARFVPDTIGCVDKGGPGAG